MKRAQIVLYLREAVKDLGQPRIELVSPKMNGETSTANIQFSIKCQTADHNSQIYY